MRTTGRTEMESAGKWAAGLLSLPLFLSVLGGCSKPLPSTGLVLTQSPSTNSTTARAQDELDLRYPPGSRVVAADETFKQFKVLSKGLAAAGDPQVSYDGNSILFCGKAKATADWQIYQVRLPNGKPKPITTLPGGARNPLLLPDGRVAFVSPVVRIGSSNSPGALYATRPGGQPSRLTFTPANVSDPTLLADGRILFVSHRPCEPASASGGYGLSTINNDGTEITEFAELKNRAEPVRRPRQMPDGRVAFLVYGDVASSIRQEAKYVRSSRPFAGAERLLGTGVERVLSIQPTARGDLLVCAEPAQSTNASPGRSFLYRLPAGVPNLPEPLFCDPTWNSVEAVELSGHTPPMGRISSVEASRKTGQILCLNANFRSYQPTTGNSPGATSRVRVLAEVVGGAVRVLGEVPLQSDGSFMAEVPADVPLGFETLDSQGQVLSRLEPSIWVRPGENRACLGCHEPHNQSPRNLRPLAVRMPVPRLSLEPLKLAQRKP